MDTKENAQVLPIGKLPLNAIILEPDMKLETVERLVILSTLERHANNRTRTAKVLGICIRTLRNKLRKFNLNDELESQIAA